ncbi:hypothetical protein [Shimia sp.]
MKAFILSCVAVVAIAIIAYYGLNAAGFSAQDVASGNSVRLD